MKNIYHKYDTKVFIILVKYLPVFTALIIITHAYIQILGVEDKILDHLVRINTFPALFMLTASMLFKFCWVHRMFIWYDFIMTLEMTYHEEWGFEETLTLHRIGAIIIGIAIFILLFYKRKCFMKCGNKLLLINNRNN